MSDDRVADTVKRGLPANQSTTGMVGGGFYDAHSEPQMAAISAVLPWVETAVQALDLADPQACVGLADFGCSEGRNSIALMSRAVKALRTHTSRAIQTIHSDLPTNDFSHLLLALRPDGHSVYGDANVYTSVVGGSMFDRLLPPASIHLATTFNAIGFLSKRPLERLPDYILPNGPSALGGRGSVSARDQAVFADQALADVTAFLRARAAELVPGGKLLLQVFGSGDGARACDGVYDLLNDAVLDFVEAGDIGRADYAGYYQPVYFRTLEELVAPVRSEGGDLAPLYRLERAETYEVPVSFVEAYRADGDLHSYARSYVGFFRAFTEPVLRGALAHLDDLDRLIERVYERAEERLAARPSGYPFRYVALAALMTRRV